MQHEIAINPPPNWAATDQDLLCPLCGYNLRGLIESRCPECGFKFTWRELLEAEKNKHLYLFEYGKGRNLKTFWKTYWRTCQPRRFWREVSPAQEVRWVRLILYCILSSSVIATLAAAPYAKPTWESAYEVITQRPAFKLIRGLPKYFSNGGSTDFPFGWSGPLSAAQLEEELPAPWHMQFWRNVEILKSQSVYTRFGFGPHGIAIPTIGWGVIFLAWPILSLIALLIFRLSMRHAKIRISHLVRSIVYRCDFGFLTLTVAVGSSFFIAVPHLGWDSLAVASVCAIITTYRLTIAFRQYLRVHLPLATVLASQLIALLIVFILLVQIADFSRRI